MPKITVNGHSIQSYSLRDKRYLTTLIPNLKTKFYLDVVFKSYEYNRYLKTRKIYLINHLFESIKRKFSIKSIKSIFYKGFNNKDKNKTQKISALTYGNCNYFCIKLCSMVLNFDITNYWKIRIFVRYSFFFCFDFSMKTVQVRNDE